MNLRVSAIFIALLFIGCKKHMSQGMPAFDIHFESVSSAERFRHTLSTFLDRQGFHPSSSNFLIYKMQSDGNSESEFAGSYNGSAPILLRVWQSKNRDISTIHASVEWSIYGYASDRRKMQDKAQVFIATLNELQNTVEQGAAANP